MDLLSRPFLSIQLKLLLSPYEPVSLLFIYLIHLFSFTFLYEFFKTLTFFVQHIKIYVILHLIYMLM